MHPDYELTPVDPERDAAEWVAHLNEAAGETK